MNKNVIAIIVSAITTLPIQSSFAQDGESEVLGLQGGRPYFNISTQNIELSGTGNDGMGIGLTIGYELAEPTLLGSPNISLNYVFADLDNDVEYSSLALMGGFRGWGTKVYPVYGLGLARRDVNYSLGENTSFNQLVYYGGIGASLGNSLSAALVYSASNPLGQDDSNPANDNINSLSIQLGYGSFTGIARF